MKSYLIPLCLFSVSSIASLLSVSASPASAACVMVDPAVQVAVHGSRIPATQSNAVNMESDGRCLGAVTTNVGEQVYVGPGPVEQIRESNHFTGGDPAYDPGVDQPVIGVPVYVPVDVYAPAYDSEFYGDLPYTQYPADAGYGDPYTQYPADAGYGYPSGY